MTERNWNLPCCRARLRSARRRHGGSLRSVPGASNLARKNKRGQKIRVTTLDAYTSAASLILKHVRNWSYDTLEREVRANLAIARSPALETRKYRMPRRWHDWGKSSGQK